MIRCIRQNCDFNSPFELILEKNMEFSSFAEETYILYFNDKESYQFVLY